MAKATGIKFTTLALYGTSAPPEDKTLYANKEERQVSGSGTWWHRKQRRNRR